MDEILKRIEEDFFYLKNLWKEYKKLFSKKESIEEMNKYSGQCFKTIQLAMNNEIIITINRLLDNYSTGKNKNLVLESLINYMKNDNKEFLKKKLDNIKKNRDFCKLKELRDKRLAHRDINQKSDFLLMNYNCIEEIIVDIEEFFKFFREENKLEYIEYSEFITGPDCSNLIKAMKFFNENYLKDN